MFLGRIMKEKGLDELFWASRKLHEDGADFVLDLVGFFEDEYREQVDTLVSDGIAVFHGFQSDPVPYYAAADCIVLPSYHEGMSNVLLEASAIGRPVITSDIPGCREAVVDSETGYLCRVQDKNEVYFAMRKVLSLCYEERKLKGLNARKHMERKFNKNNVVQDTLKKLFT